MAEGSSSSGSHSLFQGKQFWLSQNIPQRSRFKELIVQHGGVIRLLEKDADIKLVDHTRKNLPPDVYSYKYVEDSIRNQKLSKLESHRVGPSPARPVGATYVPSRGLKIEYTLEDDQLLWDWMQQYEGKTGYPISGNKIYQDLAAAHPRHTYQSYRDRYLKRLRGYPRPGRLVRPTEASSSTTRPPQANAENRQPSPEPAVANVDSNERSNNAPLDTEEQPQQRAGSASNKQDETTHQRTRDTSIHAPTTTDARPQQRRELTTNKQDPPKRKRSPDIGLISEIIEAPSQKRIRQSEPTTREARPSENNHQSGAMHDTEQSEINETQLEEPENPTGNGPENQEDNLLLELPFFPSSPESEVEEPEQDIDEWIDECIQTGKAQNDKQVIEALRCASMDPSVADKALGYLVKGRGVPDDMPGVWTTEDDRALEGTNARAMERVMKKHGTDFVHARWEYLGLARTAGLIDD